MSTITSGLPDISLGYYVPALPFVHAVISVDFGSLNRTNHPDSIHGSRIDAATLPEGESKNTTRRIFSYVSQNGTSSNTWRRDDEGYDVGIESGDAYAVWQQAGYGICCTGSLKEAQFLTEKCGLKEVVFIDEAYLQQVVDHLAYRKDMWTASREFPAGTDLVDTCTNSFYRNQRLCQLIEEFQKLFFEHLSTAEMEKNRNAFLKLKNVSSLFL